AQRNEVIARAYQLGAEALLGVDLAWQLLGNLQYHVLFIDLARTDGSRILAAVPGIDGDHDVALAAGQRWQLDSRQGGRHGRRRGLRRGGDRQLGRAVGILVEQVDHQAMPVLLVRRQGEALWRDLGFQVDDQAQGIVVE